MLVSAQVEIIRSIKIIMIHRGHHELLLCNVNKIKVFLLKLPFGITDANYTDTYKM